MDPSQLFKRPHAPGRGGDGDDGDDGAVRGGPSGSKLAAVAAQKGKRPRLQSDGDDDEGDSYRVGEALGGRSGGRASGMEEEDMDGEGDDHGGSSSSYAQHVASIPSDDLDKDRISEIIDNLPETDVPVLDLSSMKKIVLKVERAINKNQQQRLKYPDQPDKFMESEVDLDEELKRIQILATAPHLYDDLVALNVIPSWVQLLGHENTDIAIDVVDLVKELTDADLSANDAETMSRLIDALLAENILQLLAQNLGRLDETVPEESQGVFNIFALLENLLEVMPDIGNKVGAETDFLQYALDRISAKTFDANRQYCSEILAILLQTSAPNRSKLGELGGIDTLLKTLAPYRKKDPASSDEIELLENLFDATCSCLLDSENKRRFLEGEGIELMNLMINEKKLSRKGAMKTLSYALADPDAVDNCNHFVEAKGLPVLFPVFMQRGAKKLKKEYKDNYNESEEEDHTITILAQLLRHVDGPRRDRLLSKFLENDYEKADRLVELHFKYFAKVEHTDEEIDREKEEIKESGEEIGPEDEDDFYLRRLEGGLFQLQLIDLSLAYICTCEEPSIRERVMKNMKSKGSALPSITRTLTEYATVVGETATEQQRDKQRADVHTLISRLGETVETVS